MIAKAEVGVREVVSQRTRELGIFFIMPLTLTEPIFNDFQEDGFSEETLKLRLTFLCNVLFTQKVKVSPENPFSWKLLKIGSVESAGA